jgi:predicted dehydrogenase
MADPVELGLIGCGRIAQTAHLPALRKARGVRLTALCDVRPRVAETIAARYGIDRVYHNVEDLLGDPRVAAVLVAVPDRLHVDVAARSLRAGKHVLVEKPIGTTVREAEPLLQLAAERGLVLQVGAMKRHDPGIAFAQSFIRDRVGQILSFDARYCVSRFRPGFEATLFEPLIVEGTPDERDVRYKLDRSRYLLVTHGAHVFDSIRFLLGDLDGLCARLERREDAYSWHGLARLTAGGLGHFELTVPVTGDWDEGFEVRGEEGSVSITTYFPFFRRPSTVRAFDGRRGEWTSPLCAESDPYVRQVEAFVDAIAGSSPVSPDAYDGVAALRIIETVERAVASGDWERVVA